MQASPRRGVRLLVSLLVAALAVVVAAPAASSGSAQHGTAKISKKTKKKKKAAGGPVTLLGIDAEDGGPGSHGPVASYSATLSSVIAKVKKSGSGLLVIGGGKSPTDSVTTFWNAVAAGSGIAVTYVNGSAISTANLKAFKVIAIASSASETPGGGLTQAEQDLLNARAAEVSSFIDSGGGLIGLTQSGLVNPYAYIARLGAITSVGGGSYSDITPTAAGLAVGITNALDVCCWHETYTRFPSFLKVLATDNSPGSQFGQAAALGGGSVVTKPQPKKKKKAKKKPGFTG